MSDICTHIECEEDKKQGGWNYCKYHQDGGELGNGGLFDQYQIIEQDFIDFIKIIPIDEEEHLKVYSPVLKDIIIRCCVQIETFFKEWAKYSISNNSEISLYSKYMSLKGGELRKERAWNFGDYYYFKSEFDIHKVFVRATNQTLMPFETWESEKNAPFWWNAYNAIKHSGISSKREGNLKNALYALAALFQMQCVNRYSRSFLQEYQNTSMVQSFEKVKITFHGISSPIDSKRYLFKEVNFSSKTIELISQKGLENQIGRKWRR